MGGTEEIYPYFQHVCSALHHMCWECPQNPHRDLDLRPLDALQETLAWETNDSTKADHATRLVRFAVATRADVLQQRYEDDYSSSSSLALPLAPAALCIRCMCGHR